MMSPASVTSPQVQSTTGDEFVLRPLMQMRTYPKGVELLPQGAELEEVVRLEDGVTKSVRVDEEGTETILELAFAGAWLGTAAVLACAPNPATIVTCTRSVVAQIPAGHFRQLVDHDPAVSAWIHRLHARELCRQTAWMSQLSSASSRLRLQRVIRQLIVAFGLRRSAGGIRLQIPLCHRELAQLIAITPEHLSRLLKAMESEGVIRRSNGWVIVPELNKLCSECGTDSAPFCEAAFADGCKLNLRQDCK